MDNYEIFWLIILVIFSLYSFIFTINHKDNSNVLIGWFGYLISIFIWLSILLEPNTPFPVNVGIKIADWGAKEYTHFLLFAIFCGILLTFPMLIREAKRKHLFKITIKGNLL